ncbi:MAG: hypothetical protein QXO96_07135 [Sulfolobales archaeon]|jgi:hypothetical protein
MEVGNIIHYDFTIDFPEMKKEPSLMGDHEAFAPIREDKSAELWRIESKYVNLLEKYNKLLAILVKISNENELHELKKELLELIEKEASVSRT